MDGFWAVFLFFYPAFKAVQRGGMQGKQRYKGQVCVALPSQLWPVMTAVVCYKGQALLQLFPHINQQQAGQ